MSKRFKPIIKHDVVTRTYTIRNEKGIVIQVPDVIIDELDNYYKAELDTLIDDLSWYKAKVSRLEREIKRIGSKMKVLNISTSYPKSPNTSATNHRAARISILERSWMILGLRRVSNDR